MKYSKQLFSLGGHWVVAYVSLLVSLVELFNCKQLKRMYNTATYLISIISMLGLVVNSKRSSMVLVSKSFKRSLSKYS